MGIQQVFDSLHRLWGDGLNLLRQIQEPVDGASAAAPKPVAEPGPTAPAAAEGSVKAPRAKPVRRRRKAEEGTGGAAAAEGAVPGPAPVASAPTQAPTATPEPAAVAAVQLREDPAAAALRERIAAARMRMDELVARKAEMDQAILNFQIAQYEALGETLETCLGLRLEYLRLKAERSGSDEDQRAAREAEAEFDACQATAADEGDALQALGDEERAELKQRYRSAAMRCHPDRVADADKTDAGALFLRVQQAYRAADLPALRALCRELDAGHSHLGGAAVVGIDALRRELNEIHDHTADLMLAIQTARLDPQYRKAYHPESWPTDFAEARAHLEAECDELRWNIRVMLRR